MQKELSRISCSEERPTSDRGSVVITHTSLHGQVSQVARCGHPLEIKSEKVPRSLRVGSMQRTLDQHVTGAAGGGRRLCV
jgi:hypothetical protein